MLNSIIQYYRYLIVYTEKERVLLSGKQYNLVQDKAMQLFRYPNQGAGFSGFKGGFDIKFKAVSSEFEGAPASGPWTPIISSPG